MKWNKKHTFNECIHCVLIKFETIQCCWFKFMLFFACLIQIAGLPVFVGVWLKGVEMGI